MLDLKNLEVPFYFVLITKLKKVLKVIQQNVNTKDILHEIKSRKN